MSARYPPPADVQSVSLIIQSAMASVATETLVPFVERADRAARSILEPIAAREEELRRERDEARGWVHWLVRQAKAPGLTDAERVSIVAHFPANEYPPSEIEALRAELAEAERVLEPAAKYLNDLGDNLLRNDVDMLLDDCEDPKDVAERLSAFLTRRKGER